LLGSVVLAVALLQEAEARLDFSQELRMTALLSSDMILLDVAEGEPACGP